MGCVVVKPKKSELSILFSSWSSRFPPLSLICFITLHHGRWRVIKSKSTKGYFINSPIRKWFTVFCVIVKITKLVEVKRTFFFFIWADIFRELQSHILFINFKLCKSLKNIYQSPSKQKQQLNCDFPQLPKNSFLMGSLSKSVCWFDVYPFMFKS